MATAKKKKKSTQPLIKYKFDIKNDGKTITIKADSERPLSFADLHDIVDDIERQQYPVDSSLN